jgi:hypothetical protein
MVDSDQLGFSFKAPERRLWRVRDLVAAVRTHIEREYFDTWVEGEISNLRAHDSGHFYFTLKDDSSQLSSVMFRSQARLLRFRPENGMQVVVRGRVTIYEERGQMQIVAEHMEPNGAGALQLAFEQLKARGGGTVRRKEQEGHPSIAALHRDRDFSPGGGASRHSAGPPTAASHGKYLDFSRPSAR